LEEFIFGSNDEDAAFAILLATKNGFARLQPFCSIPQEQQPAWKGSVLIKSIEISGLDTSSNGYPSNTRWAPKPACFPEKIAVGFGLSSIEIAHLADLQVVLCE
jgi:hypothetical protein